MTEVVLADSDSWVVDPAQNGATYRVTLSNPPTSPLARGLVHLCAGR